MGMQRRDHELGQQPRTRIEQCQQPRHGQATAGLLFPRLAEFLLSYRGIGHRAPRAIKEGRAMPMPMSVLQGRRSGRLANALQEVFQHR